MKICLLTAGYPPENLEGIARQRFTLATALAQLNHEVHVITFGKKNETVLEHGVHIHRINIYNARNSFSSKHPDLDRSLTNSQAFYEGIQEITKKNKIDIIDIPLWGGQGIVAQQNRLSPVVIWLQTTTAQVIKIQGRTPCNAELAQIELENLSLQLANGVLGDSQSIIDEVKKDYRLKPDIPIGIAHLGLSSLQPQPKKTKRKNITALIVGRLEKRKGIHLLYRIIPQLLTDHPELCFRFVGRDNSQADGYTTSYPDYFKNKYPQFAQRVFFDGYVSEQELQEKYQQADLVLVSSLYESFGLVYLEAMRAKLPIVAFKSGAAVEIFRQDEQDGAVLVEEGDLDGYARAIERLINEPALRETIAKAGAERFEAEFSAKKMAQTTAEFYESVIRQEKKRNIPDGQVYQVMEALDYGDAVSTITIQNAEILKELNQPAEILARYAHEAVRHYTLPRHKVLTNPQAHLIFHYWHYSNSAWMLPVTQGRKALYYHNITPAEFFDPASETHAMIKKGYQQLAKIADKFDLLIGDSLYNIQQLTPYLSSPRPGLVIQPVIDVEGLLAANYDARLHTELGWRKHTNILFTGRIARNKRQDQIMRVFDYYYRNINRDAFLWLVGNENGDKAYRAELEKLRLSLISAERICFTGKISDERVRTLYRNAHIFLSASEHEGFGMPLIEAMAFGVPVLAKASSAVPETMGQGGILINEWDIPKIAELMNIVVADQNVRQKILAKQTENLTRFSRQNAQVRLKAAVDYLLHQTESPLFEKLDPRMGEAQTGKPLKLFNQKTQPVLPYMIAFTLRCGSTLYCEYLTANGLGRPTEYFQFPYGVKNAWLYDALGVSKNDFKGLMLEVIRQCSPNGIFGAKMDWWQKKVLLEEMQKHDPDIQDIDDIFPNVKWVYIQRKDKAAQAVSLWRAAYSGRWHSPDSAQKRKKPRYNFRDVYVLYASILVEEKNWERYFKERAIDPFAFYYEDLLENPRKIIMQTADFIQAPYHLLVSEADVKLETQLEKLADTYSQEITARFIEDLNNIGTIED